MSITEQPEPNRFTVPAGDTQVFKSRGSLQTERVTEWHITAEPGTVHLLPMMGTSGSTLMVVSALDAHTLAHALLAAAARANRPAEKR